MPVKVNPLLWSKIESFPLDEPGAENNFSKKLASAQNWSPTFTQSVIEEYRRFIYLCCISETGAAPSDAVDQAWHLHLTYTKSYWVDFCKHTLDKEIHHYPSKGGTAENQKHQQWYEDTLGLYEQEFGIKPPSSIWPMPVKPLPQPGLMESITEGKTIVISLSVLLIPFLYTAIFYKVLDPFQLTGPSFLWYFPVLALACITGSFIVQLQQESNLKKILIADYPEKASLFQWAQFLDGKHKGLQTAIVDLMRRNLLVLKKDKLMEVHANNYVRPEIEMNPLVPALLKEPANKSLTYNDIDAEWYQEKLFRHPVFERWFALAHQDQPFWQRWLFQIVFLSIGIARLIQGLYHGRPVLYLVVEIVILSMIYLILSNVLMLPNLLFTNARKLFLTRVKGEEIYPDSLITAFAIEGIPAIKGFNEGLLLASIFTVYPPLRSRSPGLGYSGGTCSNCSGTTSCSSCSSGSSCGGGGCGGCSGG